MSESPREKKLSHAERERKGREYEARVTQELSASVYGPYISDIWFPAAEEQRTIPYTVRKVLESIDAGSSTHKLLPQLAMIESYLQQPIIFDTLTDANREKVRDELKLQQPDVYAYYFNNPMRINRTNDVVMAIEVLAGYIDPIIKKADFGRMNEAVADDFRAQIRRRWKEIQKEHPEFTPQQLTDMRKEFILGELTVAAQFAFDVAVYVFNGRKVIGTTGDGHVTHNMRMLATNRGRKRNI